jgi:hypothetical protein
MAFPVMPQRPTQREFLVAESSVEVRVWQDQRMLDLVPPLASGDQLRHLGSSYELNTNRNLRSAKWDSSRSYAAAILGSPCPLWVKSGRPMDWLSSLNFLTCHILPSIRA